MSDPIEVTDRSMAVMLCLFRTCDWRSEDVRTMPADVQEATVARHFLAAHREELATLGRFAADAGLLP